MANKNEKEKLTKVSGGACEGSNLLTCPKCFHRFLPQNVETRSVSKGCVSVIETKCPKCGEWFE